MPRGLDHVVHLVRDLDAAGELYDLLGFTVGGRNQHPWGTHNRIVQTPGFYVELLQVAEPEKIPPGEPGRLSFGAVNGDFLARNGEGLSMLVLEGRDPAAEKAAFDAAGFGGFETFDFTRMARRMDGAEVEVGFSLAFARAPGEEDFTAFTCTQRKPENFWSAALQQHSNHVEAVAGVVLVADAPEAEAAFISILADVPATPVTEGWLKAETPRGRIDVLTRPLYAERYGVPAPGPAGLRLAAVRFATRGAPDVRRALAARRMVQEGVTGVAVVPPSVAMGAALVFEPVE